MDSNIYNAGQEVNIKNGTGVIPPPGKLFDGWEYEGKYYNAGNTDTDKLTMPSKNITLKARYSDDKNNDGIPDKYQNLLSKILWSIWSLAIRSRISLAPLPSGDLQPLSYSRVLYI